MNFGSSIKKIAANINVSLKFYKLTGGCKPNSIGSVLDVLKSKNDSILKEQLKPLSLCLNQKDNIFFPPSKSDIVGKSIIEPDQNAKIKFELPLSNTGNTALELPLYIEKEISEPPGLVIVKHAMHMVRIRKLKMKKHKKKKHLRKFKVPIQTRKIRKQNLEEAELQKNVRNIIECSQNFSAEQYVSKTLEKYNYVKPVTFVRGYLAPDWVIKQHLKDQEIKKLIRERFTECINSRK